MREKETKQRQVALRGTLTTKSAPLWLNRSKRFLAETASSPLSSSHNRRLGERAARCQCCPDPCVT